ncbi:inter-alpha-trypsin inhibitor heavy chain H3-like isoform X2 [Clavelina lepadiformis]|uniref:inter-alpha-trypsin inhibitor heavy chain H3-like isoform X2 n=1 Tax=Clavelina lepadiformis TaxID=159417 RepID=UPI004042D935
MVFSLTYLAIITCILKAFSAEAKNVFVYLSASPKTESFASQNYPRNYPNNASTVWMITSSTSDQVELKLLGFDTEKDFDIVQIRDGDSLESMLLATFHGREVDTNSIVSSRRKLLVSFTTDGSVSYRGFNISYRTVLFTDIKITSFIHSGLVDTCVTSDVINDSNITRTVSFLHILPEKALISYFSIKINNTYIPGRLMTKHSLPTIYEDHPVHQLKKKTHPESGEVLRKFEMIYRMQPNTGIQFKLKYSHVLFRSQSRYLYKGIFLRENLVNSLIADVYVCTNVNTKFLRTPTPSIFSEMDILHGTVLEKKGNFSHITFRSVGKHNNPLWKSEIYVEYDTERTAESGCVFVDERGYFIHKFSPNLPALPRKVIFVLDISGSMAGRKIQQVRSAVSNILQTLGNKDSFNIVLFESVARVWKTDVGLVRATAGNLISARRYISAIDPEGATNINEAIVTALDLLQRDNKEDSSKVNPFLDFIIFLTDGQPTVGARSTDVILKNVEKKNNQGYGIIAIGFGKHVDSGFLQELAKKNKGIWGHISEKADASIQIQKFLTKTLIAPILFDVKLTYRPNIATLSTKLFHSVLRRGGEIVVAGKIEGTSRMPATGDIVSLIATGKTDKDKKNMTYELEVCPIQDCVIPDATEDKKENLAERFYAILRLRDISRYSLVTNMTILIVEKNNSRLPTHVQPRSPNFPGLPVNSGDVLPWIFEGDPHFIVRLNQKIKVCFTLGGIPNKVYRILHDSKLGVTVNGFIVRAPPSGLTDEIHKTNFPNKAPETYFQRLSFIFTRVKLSFLVSPHNVTIVNNTNTKKSHEYTIDASDDFFLLNEIEIKFSIYGVGKMYSYVNLTLPEKVTFIVKLHRTRDQVLLNHTEHREDHLDMEVDGAQHLSKQISGIFGDIASTSLHSSWQNPKILKHEKQFILFYRNQQTKVHKAFLHNPMKRHSYVPCWHVCDSRILTGKPVSSYLVPDLLNTGS